MEFTTITNINVICAMLGNFRAESGYNSGVWNGHAKISYSKVTDSSILRAFGLAQWYARRRVNMGKALEDANYKVYDLKGQVEYIFTEASWTGAYDIYGYKTFSSFINSDSSDLYALTYSWLACWEIPTTVRSELLTECANRYKYALEALEYIKNNGDSYVEAGNFTYYYSLTGLSSKEMYNNLLYIWYLLSNGIISGSSSYGHKDGIGIVYMTEPQWRRMLKMRLKRRNYI